MIQSFKYSTLMYNEAPVNSRYTVCKLKLYVHCIGSVSASVVKMNPMGASESIYTTFSGRRNAHGDLPKSD